LEDEPAEVKGYRRLYEEDKLPRPECRSPECRVQRRGFRERTDVRLADGRVLQPIPVPIYRCKDHGAVPFLVPFLAGRKRYLSAVVETVLEVFARGSQALERLFSDDGGPDARTLRRWVRPLTMPAVQSWVRGKLERWARGTPSPATPPGGRPEAWEAFHGLKLLARGLSGEGWPVSLPALLMQAPAST
jgi:hypothetical protein